MLDEEEWLQLSGMDIITLIQNVRLERGLTIREAQHVVQVELLRRYHALTGFFETNLDALWHHRLSLFGPPCARCGKPLRTPQAKHCAACGADR
jgi:hypothetical protein